MIQMLVKFKRNGHVCPGFLFIKTPCITQHACLTASNARKMHIVIYFCNLSLLRVSSFSDMHCKNISNETRKVFAANVFGSLHFRVKKSIMYTCFCITVANCSPDYFYITVDDMASCLPEDDRFCWHEIVGTILLLLTSTLNVCY